MLKANFQPLVAGFRSPDSGRRFMLCVLPLAWLWGVLINDLRVEWTLNPQYGYGWAVPFLCLFLLGRRVQNSESRKPKVEAGGQRAAGGRQKAEGSSERPGQFSVFRFQVLIVVLALLYAPTRLIQEANPGWRLVSWALALEVIGLTLCVLRLTIYDIRFAIFPLGFFLVAVPWSSQIELPLIQGLTRLDAQATVELLGWLGVPALAHGNVIEVATGVVGIEEACSGIRSFQATLMLSLFFGEFYRLRLVGRLGLVGAGFALSLFFNLARMTVLVWVAAHRGVAAIATWHDPTGISILLACFFGLWGLSVWLAHIKKAGHATPPAPRQPATRQPPPAPLPEATLRWLVMALIGWIALTEFGVAAWYDWHEARLPAAQKWSLAWPVNNPTFKEEPLADRAREILRYDDGRSAAWEADGMAWQAVLLQWQPGSAAIHVAQNHTPEVCMTAAGHELKSFSPQDWFDVNGLHLPFLTYEVTDAARPYFVFYCLWDDRASARGFATEMLTYGNRLTPVLQGQRNPGQRSLEIAVIGPDTVEAARAALQAELEKLVVTQP